MSDRDGAGRVGAAFAFHAEVAVIRIATRETKRMAPRVLMLAVISRGCLAAVVALCGLGAAATAETVRVELADGRILRGEVDARSSAERLWVRFEADGAFLLRPIAWEQVAKVHVGEAAQESAAFRARIENWKSPHPRIADWVAPPATPPASAAANRDAEQEPRRAVRTLAAGADVANWDDDPEVDGLVVRIRPRDARGNVVPVSGTLQVSLVGYDRGVVRDGDDFPALGRWTQRVAPEDFTSGGAEYELPFQAVHPEFDLHIGSRGAVIVELTVPGVGTFRDTVGSTVIRPYSGVRDRLQQRTGSRFFPVERTGRGER